MSWLGCWLAKLALLCFAMAIAMAVVTIVLAVAMVVVGPCVGAQLLEELGVSWLGCWLAAPRAWHELTTASCFAYWCCAVAAVLSAGVSVTSAA